MADSDSRAEIDRDRILALSDEALLRECRVDTFRGTGRGGQKRNRTESAVRLTHQSTGVVVTCDDTRSQHSNRELALRKLRFHIGLQVRCPPATEGIVYGPAPNPRNPQFAQWTANLLDVLEAHAYRIAESAEHLGVSTARLVRDIADCPAIWQEVNRVRTARGMSPLKRPS